MSAIYRDRDDKIAVRIERIDESIFNAINQEFLSASISSTGRIINEGYTDYSVLPECKIWRAQKNKAGGLDIMRGSQYTTFPFLINLCCEDKCEFIAKIFRYDINTPRTEYESFVREIKLTIKCGEDDISPRVFDAFILTTTNSFIQAKLYVLIMKRLHITLFDYVKANNKVTTDIQRAIMNKAQKLAKDYNCVHNDLHSKNVMLDESGVPYIIDFGIMACGGDMLNYNLISSIYRLILTIGSIPTEFTQKRAEIEDINASLDECKIVPEDAAHMQTMSAHQLVSSRIENLKKELDKSTKRSRLIDWNGPFNEIKNVYEFLEENNISFPIYEKCMNKIGLERLLENPDLLEKTINVALEHIKYLKC